MGIVMRAQGATTKAFPVRTVEEEQRSDRAQDPCALRVAAARGHLRCWLASTMCIDITLGRATRSKRPTGQPSLRLAPSDAKRTLRTSGSLGGSVVIWPRGARNAAPSTFTTDC